MDYTGHYELMFIIQPDLGETATDEVFEKVRSLFVDRGVTIHTADKWGQRKLAYRVRGFWEGFYVLFHFQTHDRSVLEGLDYVIRTEPRIIRHLLVRLPKAKFMEDERQKAVAEKRRVQEEARAKAEAEERTRAENAAAAAEERTRAEASAVAREPMAEAVPAVADDAPAVVVDPGDAPDADLVDERITT